MSGFDWLAVATGCDVDVCDVMVETDDALNFAISAAPSLHDNSPNLDFRFLSPVFIGSLMCVRRIWIERKSAKIMTARGMKKDTSDEYTAKVRLKMPHCRSVSLVSSSTACRT